jgi:sugar (pentulose or hexulose) kinase
LDNEKNGSTLFLGIDVGTQGARAVLIDVKGNMVAGSEEAFPLSNQSREEQSPAEWWQACLRSLKTMLAEAKKTIFLTGIKAISVTSTSGTVIPLDKYNQPLHNAIMYSDNRSAGQAKICKQAALDYNSSGYKGFNSSSGLSKMVWFVQTHPKQAQRLSKWIHAADFINGSLAITGASPIILMHSSQVTMLRSWSGLRICIISSH